MRAHVLIKLAARTAPVRFEALLLERGAVRVAWAVTGDFDYEIRLTCASLRDLTAELRALRDCGAEQTTTFLLLHEIVTDASRG